MAAESSSASAGRSSSGASADSYIGSLISLTSKSEIRYEGILYNINTDESSIGLRNVRSFGTEGRKKDGPQVPPGDKIYEYILFRGSDIKDLQVKSSPPVQTPQAAPPVPSDPAIIQSHYSRPPLSTTIPSAVSGSLPDLGSHNPAQLGFHGSTFQGGLPLYQPGGNMSSWGPSPPPNANGGGLAMPMYWPGYYGTPNGLPQQPLLRPPPGLSLPPSMQQFPYSGSSMAPGGPGLQGSNLTEYPSPLAPITSTSLVNLSSLPTSTLPLSISTVEHPTFPSVTSGLMSNKAVISSIPALSSSTLPAFSPLAPVSSADLKPVVPSLPNKSNAVPAPVLQQPIKTQPATAVAGTPSASFVDTPTLPLVTPGQLLQSGSTSVSLNQPSQTAQKDVEVVQVSTMSSDPPAPQSADAQPPILPLPPAARSHRPNGAPFHGRFNYRGRGGRGNGMARPVTRFAEDFDFEAMNEKFNKDEVWGHLGKSNQHSKEGEGNRVDSDEDYSQDEYEAELPKVEIKPVYNKDDFFDSLSSNTAHNEPNNGWTRFSEQKKIDTETFGDFARYRGGRGGRGPFRGGRSRGSSYGRGYGYNYAGRGGRGRGVSSRDY